MAKTYLSLAAYNYKRAKYQADRGDIAKCQKHLATARMYDKFAKEEDA